MIYIIRLLITIGLCFIWAVIIWTICYTCNFEISNMMEVFGYIYVGYSSLLLADMIINNFKKKKNE